MKINKNLKFADFSYDEVSKTFTIADKNGNQVELNKVYSFAFMRFVVRIAQRNWLRTKKVVDNPNDCVVELEDNEEKNPAQMSFAYSEHDPVQGEQDLQTYSG